MGNGRVDNPSLYEPLCAWLTTQLGGRLVKVDCSREETFVSNRVVRVFFMKLGRVRLHGLLHIQDKGLFVVRYRHQSSLPY